MSHNFFLKKPNGIHEYEYEHANCKAHTVEKKYIMETFGFGYGWVTIHALSSRQTMKTNQIYRNMHASPVHIRTKISFRKQHDER